MPITFAHPAAVLPLRGLGLPMSALVAGSMAPDLPVFVHQWRWYAVTHSWPGVVTVDVALALVALAVWLGLVRDPVVDLMPQRVRDRLTTSVRWQVRAWLLALPAAALGAATHVGWDQFTHPGRWGERHVPWLAAHAGGMPGYLWLQLASGLAGMAVVAAVAVGWLARQPVRPRPRLVAGGPLAAVGALLPAGVLTLLAVLAAEPPSVHALAFTAVTRGVLVTAIAMLALSLWWQRSARGTGTQTPSP
ncbi:DUF4184 family protein [Nocardioides sp.]|uniref:DUF4184 family protein n=1 Tax=Nocardioides sp. TaxID=35761 RepID=UPI003527ADAF